LRIGPYSRAAHPIIIIFWIWSKLRYDKTST
jgi:hypothetical protein